MKNKIQNYNEKLSDFGNFAVTEYKGIKTKVLHTCTKCGFSFICSPNSMLSNKNYCKHCNYKKLIEKQNIKVLEYFKGSLVKIKHQCSCGNIWSNTPNNIKNGNKCGCEKYGTKLDGSKYKELLLTKGIKIILLDEYKDYTTKVKHKCTCGNIWETSPISILRGNGCGCNKVHFHTKSFYKNKKTILYYIIVDNMWKIGITLYKNKYSIENNIYLKRFRKDIKNKINIEIIKTKTFKDGSEAFEMESKIKKSFRKYKYNKSIDESKKDFIGYTELFIKDIGDKLEF